MVVKEEIRVVEKVWGREVIVVNREYCGKLLLLDKGARSSLHRHSRKTETFYCLAGQVGLEVEGKSYMLNPFARPKTITPGQFHSFWGISAATILEVSSGHDDRDVFRLMESQAGEPGEWPDTIPIVKQVVLKEMLEGGANV